MQYLMTAILSIDFDRIKQNLREGKYKYIGSGSGRIVYDLDNGYVIKVAKNKKGIAQNEVEYQISTSYSSDLFAKIPQVSEDFKLLIMEKAERIRNFSVILDYFQVKSKSEFLKLNELEYLYTTLNLMPMDLCRSVNWGTINNRPVIIDYGFNKKVKRKYYSLF